MDIIKIFSFNLIHNSFLSIYCNVQTIFMAKTDLMCKEKEGKRLKAFGTNRDERRNYGIK